MAVPAPRGRRISRTYAMVRWRITPPSLAGAETARNDGAWGGATGGGYSTHFRRPGWQSGNARTGRGVPDVAGDADPATGYNVTVDGRDTVIGGTSAVAPL